MLLPFHLSGERGGEVYACVCVWLEQQIAISFFHNRRRRQLINCYFCAPPFPSPQELHASFVCWRRKDANRPCVAVVVVCAVVIVVIHCC